MRSVFAVPVSAVGLGVALLLAGCRAEKPAMPAPPPLAEIHVNQQCLIRPTGAAEFTRDPVVCHLEARFDSTHVAARVDDGVARRSNVRIVEQEYLLQNVTTAPVRFVIEQPVPAGWRVDSDPQPDELHNGMAIFRVVAEPQQIIRLHVGERHDTPLS